MTVRRHFARINDLHSKTSYCDKECTEVVELSDYMALDRELEVESEAHAALQSRCFDYGGTFQNIFDDHKAAKARIAQLEAALMRIAESGWNAEDMAEVRQIARDAARTTSETKVIATTSDQSGFANPAQDGRPTSNRGTKP